MEALTPWHLALILLAFLLLFGYKRLPDASRSLGRSLRIFKAEMTELSGDASTAAASTGAVTSAAHENTPSVDELERQAAQADAEAEALRAQARGHRAEF